MLNSVLRSEATCVLLSSACSSWFETLFGRMKRPTQAIFNVKTSTFSTFCKSHPMPLHSYPCLSQSSSQNVFCHVSDIQNMAQIQFLGAKVDKVERERFINHPLPMSTFHSASAFPAHHPKILPWLKPLNSHASDFQLLLCWNVWLGWMYEVFSDCGWIVKTLYIPFLLTPNWLKILFCRWQGARFSSKKITTQPLHVKTCILPTFLSLYLRALFILFAAS